MYTIEQLGFQIAIVKENERKIKNKIFLRAHPKKTS